MYNKLFTKILDSSIWLESTPTRLVWVTLLAAMDQDGYAHFSAVGNLALRARVTMEEAQAAIDCFLSHDLNSEDQDHDGRRVERVPGGFIVLNAQKYRDIVTMAVSREQTRKRVQQHRETKRNGGVTPCNGGVTPCTVPVTQSEAEAEAEAYKEKASTSLRSVEVISDDPPEMVIEKKAKSECPFRDIVSLYHAKLPELPSVEKLTKARMGYLRQRWQEDLPSLEHWENYFAHIARSKFLMGRTAGRDGKPPFRASLEWITRPANFAKIAEETYHRG